MPWPWKSDAALSSHDLSGNPDQTRWNKGQCSRRPTEQVLIRYQHLQVLDHLAAEVASMGALTSRRRAGLQYTPRLVIAPKMSANE